MKKFISLLLCAVLAVVANAQDDPVKFLPSVDGNNLVIKYENTSGKKIANCNFQLKFDEGVSIAKKSNGRPNYKKGAATEEMESASCAYNATTGKYTFSIYGGEFDDAADGVIVTFPLVGTLTGKSVMVSNIAFGDPEEANICRPADIKVDLTEKVEPIGSVDLMGEVREGNLVFTFENTTGKVISGCSFQLLLPEGMSLIPSGGSYKYEKGDATAGMTFSISSIDNKYTITIKDGQFNKTAGNIITLPFQGKSGGAATVSKITFSAFNGNITTKSDIFTMEIPSTDNGDDNGSVALTGKVENGNLVFKYENNSGKKIANCSFQLKFDEGVSIAKKSNGRPNYKKGGATEEMESASCAYNESTGKYTFAIYGGEFDDAADGVIVSFPLVGALTGKSVSVSNIAFGDPDEANICRPTDFKVDLIENVEPVGSIDLMGEVREGNLIFTFENNSGKKIANCNFQLVLPEGVTLISNGKKYKYIEGDATEGMDFHIAFNNNNSYNVVIFNGEFDETVGNTIISLPLQGNSGGRATVSNIAFNDTNGNKICQPEDFIIDIPSTNNEDENGDIDLMGNVKDNNLVFTFENNSGKKIANCNFQLVLPEGLSVKLNPKGNYDYVKGDATEGLLFSVASKNNKYTITIYGGNFKESAGNTLITLPLQGKSGGQATVSNIAFGDPNGNSICRPKGFTIDIPSTGNGDDNGSIDLTGEVKNGNLVVKYENNSGKKIANCSFQLKFDEGVSIAKKSNGRPNYKKGGATEEMESASCAYNESTGKYTFAIYGGEFDDAADGVIVSFPLEGELADKNVTISSIAFGDSNETNICRPTDITLKLAEASEPVGTIDLKGEVKDGSLVFTFENNSGKKIANCNFQFMLPEGVTVGLNKTGDKYVYEKGDATEDMKCFVSFNNNNNIYTVAIFEGEFNETAGNTIISLPLQGKSGGQATVSNITFGDPNSNIICRPKDFTIDIPASTTGEVDLKGEVKDGKLVFTFDNTSGKKITACNFQFELPEGLSVKLNSTGKKYLYEKGAATEDMTFYISFNNNKYTVAIFGGEFNESADNTIISLTLQGRSGGQATVSNIAFGGSDGNNISRPDGFTMDLPSASNGGVDLKGEVKNGNLVFTFDNNSGTSIANCNFQFTLPEGLSVKFNSTGYKRRYEEGDATEGLTFYITSNNNQYTVAIFGGEFDEKAGNTIISLPLEGILAGETTVSNIAFGDSNGENICRPEDFTINVVGVLLKGEIINDNLVFSYENNSGKDIAACNFQFVLPEGVALMTNNETRSYVEGNAVAGRSSASSSQAYNYSAGDATEGMDFHISCLNNVYTVTISGGKFNEEAGNTIISLPLEGDVTGETTVSDIVFEDSDSARISESEGLTIETVDIELKGEAKNGNLIFTFENKSSKPITNCNFEFVLPEGISLAPNGETYKYIEGDATTGMTFSVTLSNGVYTVNVYGGRFDITAGNTILTLPLRGTTKGQATVSNISFGDPEGNITRPDAFTMNVTGGGVKGDVDGNGSVGLGDLEAILQIMAGKRETTSAADVDGNGSVGLGDIEAILRIMAGGE